MILARQSGGRDVVCAVDSRMVSKRKVVEVNLADDTAGGAVPCRRKKVSCSSASARKPTSNALQVAAMRFCANGGGVHAEFDDGEELDVFFLHEWNNDQEMRIELDSEVASASNLLAFCGAVKRCVLGSLSRAASLDKYCSPGAPKRAASFQSSRLL